MKIKSLIVVVSLVSLIFSCKQDKKDATPELITIDTTPEKVTYTAATGDAEFKDAKLAEVFSQYIQLKTSLVNTDATKAAEDASSLMTAFANVVVEENVLKAAQNIVEGDDIEAQRTAFVAVTTGVEVMLADALAAGTIYKQYCPMAFNNTGAYWLSNSKDIYNPFFGDKMLKCGRVAGEIK